MNLPEMSWEIVLIAKYFITCDRGNIRTEIDIFTFVTIMLCRRQRGVLRQQGRQIRRQAEQEGG